MEQDPNKIKGIVGLLFIVGALITTFVVPLAMAPELELVFSTGEPLSGVSVWSFGAGIVKGYAQEINLGDANGTVNMLKFKIARGKEYAPAVSNLEIGVATTPSKSTLQHLATIEKEDISFEGQWKTVEFPEMVLKANTSYYFAFYVNDMQPAGITQYIIWRSEIAQIDLSTFVIHIDSDDMGETYATVFEGKDDISLKLYGEYGIEIIEEEEEEPVEAPFLGESKNQVLVIGSILFAIGFGILFSMLEIPMIADNILILVGISALVGILWFVFVANPWMVMTVAGMIGGR